jgi:voltage-gated potassium channel
VKSILKKWIDEESSTGRFFNLFIKGLIVLSLISISVETLPGLDPGIKAALKILELITVLIFTVEYLLRIYVADKRLSFIFSFYGIIDLLAILPFYIALGLDLRSVRIFRLIRLIRMAKFARYNNAINRLVDAFHSIRAELAVFFMITICVLYVSALGIYYFENPAQPDKYVSVFHSLWWSVATLTTVGYGDVYPVTVGGRMFTFVILMIGLGLISVPTGLIASALTKTLNRDSEE